GRTADDDRPATQRRIVALLDRRVESVHVEMENDAEHRPNTRARFCAPRKPDPEGTKESVRCRMLLSSLPGLYAAAFVPSVEYMYSEVFDLKPTSSNTPLRFKNRAHLLQIGFVIMVSVLAAPVAQTCSLLFRRFLTFQLPPASNFLPITNRRYGRLKICATVTTYERVTL